MQKNSRFLITGGTGFLGSALVGRLVADGYQVRVLDNDFRGSADRLASIEGDIELVEGDIRDAGVVEAASRDVDICCHLAYINGTEHFYKQPEMVLEVGVKGIINTLDACIKNNVKEYILASSSEVYQVPSKVPTDESAGLSVPDPLNPRYSYGGGKIISELMAINYGRKHFDRMVIFRPHNVYGPQMGWEHVIPQFVVRMKEVVEKNETAFHIQGTGKETRAFIYIDDFTDGLMKVIEQGEHLNIYHIGTMDEITVEELAKEVARYFGKEITIVPGELTEGSTPRRCPDISKIRQLGFEPGIKISEGVGRTAKWYDEHYEKRPQKTN